jgi:hypothetical protein
VDQQHRGGPAWEAHSRVPRRRPVHRRAHKVALTITQQIVDDITEGDLGPDTKLASERDAGALRGGRCASTCADSPPASPPTSPGHTTSRSGGATWRPDASSAAPRGDGDTVHPPDMFGCVAALSAPLRSNALTITLYVTPGPRQPDAQTRVEERTDSGWERHYARGVAVALAWVTDAPATSSVVDGSAEPIPAADRARCRAERQRIGSSAGG